jgi:hypothetical protein
MEEVAQTTEVSIQELVSQLHKARLALSNSNNIVKQMEDKFRKEVADLYEYNAEARTHVADLEQAIREKAIAAYDGENKAIAPGVGIRVTTSYDYDADRAYEWATGHGMALSLDRKAFNDICKADSTRPDFVSVSETPTATIATDLSKVLKEE